MLMKFVSIPWNQLCIHPEYQKVCHWLSEFLLCFLWILPLNRTEATTFWVQSEPLPFIFCMVGGSIASSNALKEVLSNHSVAASNVWGLQDSQLNSALIGATCSISKGLVQRGAYIWMLPLVDWSLLDIDSWEILILFGINPRIVWTGVLVSQGHLSPCPKFITNCELIHANPYSCDLHRIRVLGFTLVRLSNSL